MATAVALAVLVAGCRFATGTAGRRSTAPKRVGTGEGGGSDEGPSAIIYNAVPKTGSRSLELLTKELGKTRGFKVEVAALGEYYPAEAEMRRTVRQTDPIFYQNHARFFGGAAGVSWISIAREPVDRLGSWFEFAKMLKKGWGVRDRNDGGCRCTDGFDACVKHWMGMARPCLVTVDGREMRSRQDMERADDHHFPLPQWRHFCDWRPNCTVDDAIRNMQTGYAVVGLTGEYELTLQLLERELPRFYSGLFQLYNASRASPKTRNRMRHSTSAHSSTAGAISTQARDWLHRVDGFDSELRFYEAAKRHFWLQVATQGLLTPGA
mmetsp:Transcript_17780/g.54164  ORF Transcript_17780/g.54164 Transcript_17780/m.54164 type:complete len:323 (+) Transcript_17780:755-1723(+)